MRFYAAGNYYLSSIQQGIQAAHALGEMFNQYPYGDSPVGRTLRDWSANHKTMVLLNGGNSAGLRDLWQLLSDPRNTSLPVSKFHEDDQSLDGALTCVAIVLPERLYEAEKVYPDADYPAWDDGLPLTERKHRWFEAGTNTMITGWEAELLDTIKRLALAK